MNNFLKYGLFFLGGVAVGAIGTVAVSRGKLDVKPFAAKVLSHGMDIKDALVARAEALREDVEDMAAEAHALQEERKAAQSEA